MKKLNQRKNYIVIILFSVALIFALALFCSCTVKTYSVTYSVIEGGTINGNANQTVKEGENGTEVTAMPNEGYKFVKWSDGVIEATRQEKNVTEDITVTAIFNKLDYTLTYNTDGSGAIAGQTTQSVTYGENGTEVTAVPNEGYEFVKWSDGLTKATRQEKNVTENISVTAVFEKLTFNLSYVVVEGGRILGTNIQTVDYGKNGKTVFAVPNEGYVFVKWSDNVTEATRQDKNITENISVTAIFEKLKFTITYTAGVGGTIEGQTEQEIEYGDAAEFVVAVPDTGYRFVKWSDGYGSTIRREFYVSKTINVTAEFEFLFTGGDGTQLNPFTIANYEQLNNIYDYPEANYKLINNLDLSGIKHEPIFDKVNFFKGNFNGGGYTVKNLTVETESNCPSLFGVIGGGTVSNLSIIDANIITTDYNTLNKSDKYYVGILAGMVKGYMHDIVIDGSITVNELNNAGVAIGGLVGFANGTVANCTCNVQMNIKHVYSKSANFPFVFGGMIGVCDSAFVRDCTAEGQINITECFWTESGSTGDLNKSSEILAGGLIGYYFTDRQVNAYIRACRTDVEIYGDNDYKAGGFVGCVDAGQDTILQITDCSVYGDVTCSQVGGFVYRAYNSRNSTLLFEKCIIENDITAYSYGTGFVYFCHNSPDGDLQIKNCYTIGNIKTRGWFDSERIVGRASGFGWQMMYVSITDSYAKRNIISSDGRGFSFYISNSEVCSCFYEGTIDISNGAGTPRGVGMFDVFSSSKLDNCYVNVNFVTGEKDTSSLYAFIRLGGGKLSNFYCYGNYRKIFESYNMQNVSNGHVFKGNIEESNLPQEGEGTAISLYDNIQDMYLLADKLNEGQDEENWVNVENALPKLKFEIR